MKKIVEHDLNIQKDYQYKALRKGNLLQRQWHRNRLLLIECLTFLSCDDNVADIGCGSGNVVLHFNKQVTHITGFDHNIRTLEFLSEKLAENKIGNASVCELDILGEVPKRLHNSFDKIIFNEVIEHFDEEDLTQVLANLKKMLNPDGKILITTPNYQLSPWPIMEFCVDKFHIYPSLWGEQHKIKFMPKKLHLLCEKNGFILVRAGTFSLFSPFLAIFGHSFADFVAKMEVKYLKLFGPQIYAIFKKK